MRVGLEFEVLGTAEKKQAFIAAATSKGINIRDAGYTHAVTSYWKIVTDASVRGGFEVVSPILNPESADHRQQIVSVCEAFNEAQCKVDSSCGLHVHVDTSELKFPQFKTLLKVFAKFEPVMDSFMPPSRRNSRWCRSILMSLGMDRAPEGDQLPVALMQFFQRVDRSRDLEHMRQTLMFTRYLKLNLEAYWRYRTVEFRQHSGTTDATKALAWVDFCTGMIERCQRENTRVLVKGCGDMDTLFKAVRRPGLKRFYRMRAEILAGARPDRRNAREGIDTTINNR